MTDCDEIRSIIERDDIKPGICENGATDEDIDRVIFFSAEGIGLFPANPMGEKTLLMHAAIPEENRGVGAIRAARELVTTLDQEGYTMFAKINREERPDVVRFAKMVGFKHVGKDIFKVIL